MGGVRNLYGAAFYDVGDAYTMGHAVGPVAHGVGGGIRADVAWFGFVERTMLRLEVAKEVNMDNPWQVVVGVQHPFLDKVAEAHDLTLMQVLFFIRTS